MQDRENFKLRGDGISSLTANVALKETIFPNR
jgi:hypothetical protein